MDRRRLCAPLHQKR